VRIAWISFLDVNIFSGGGELGQRELIDIGRARGHTIVESAFLRGKLQRTLRRTLRHSGLKVDWNADMFVLANIRNCPQLGLPFPQLLIDKILATGRVALVEDAWVDTCALDMPCDGEPSRCPEACDRRWSNDLFARVQMTIFLSPMQQRMVNAVLNAPRPRFQLVRHPYIDVTRFTRRDVRRDIDVLYVGVINEAKGYHNLIERFGPNRITFVGRSCIDGPVAGTYLGEIPYEELPTIYNRARTFAHLPEWCEPMGRTVIEAALCGCDVVTNERVGVTSFPRADWTDPDVIRGNGERFWVEFERAVEELRDGPVTSRPWATTKPAKR
jgi:glycosyltransferase involved in cell wall biosynthesis